jgi:hypothetical protein
MVQKSSVYACDVEWAGMNRVTPTLLTEHGHKNIVYVCEGECVGMNRVKSNLDGQSHGF